MNREELYYELIKLVPSHYNKENGFLDHLHDQLVIYRDEILPKFDEYPIQLKEKTAN